MDFNTRLDNNNELKNKCRGKIETNISIYAVTSFRR